MKDHLFCSHVLPHTLTYTYTHTHTQLVHGELFLYMIANSNSDQEDWLALIRQRKCVCALCV